MAQDRRKIYREYLARTFRESPLLNLELTYLDFCGRFIAEHEYIPEEAAGPGPDNAAGEESGPDGPETEEARLPGGPDSEERIESDPAGILYKMESADLLRITDRLQADEAFQAVNRQKNGRLLRALGRYTSFCIGVPEPAGRFSGPVEETGSFSAPAGAHRRSEREEDLLPPPQEEAPAAEINTEINAEIPSPRRLSRSLEELLAEPDPGNPEGIPAWRDREVSPVLRAQILRRERERRALEEKTAAAERAALQAAFAEKSKREDLQRQVDSLQRELQAGRYGRRSPEYQRLQDQIDYLQRQLLDLQLREPSSTGPAPGQPYAGIGQGMPVAAVLPGAQVPASSAGAGLQGVQIPAAGALQGVQIPVTLTVQGVQTAGGPDAINRESGRDSGAETPEETEKPADSSPAAEEESSSAWEEESKSAEEAGSMPGGEAEEGPAAEAGQDPAAEAEDRPGAEAEGAVESPDRAAACQLSPLEDPDFVPRSMKILFGKTLDTDEPEDYFWEPNNTNRVFHMNTGIIGTMGTGKTQFTKSLVAQLMMQAQDNFDGTVPGLLIFDYKGDYNESKRDFVNAVKAKVLKPYHLPFNPFSIVRTSTFRPLLPTHTANAFKDILARVYRLGPKQQSSLFRCIMSAYESRKIKSDKPATWDQTAPTFADVFEKYEKDETIPKNDSLAAAMNKLKMFELFEPDSGLTGSLFDLLQGTVVVDLSGYDPDIQSLVVAITLQLFYTQMVASGSSMLRDNLRQLTRLVLVDEADNFMSEDFPALKKILKEGREFGVGVVLSTQSLKHFQTDDNSYADYIMTWVVHNVADLKDKDVDFVFRVPQKSLRETDLLRRVKELEKFESIVKVGNEEPVAIRDLAFWELLKKGSEPKAPEAAPEPDLPAEEKVEEESAPEQA